VFVSLCAALPLVATAQWSTAPPPLAAAERVGRPGHSSITSADRRFMVSGLTSAENMVLARQLSELSTQIEAKTGMPLPMRPGQVLGVMVQSSTSPDSQVLKVQGWDGGQFYQRLVVPNRYRLDGEDLLEAASWLLLNRYAAEYAPANQRTGIGAGVPEWVSVGLTQNTQAALRSRNRDWIAREMAENRHLSLAEVVRQAAMPPGRWRDKAYAAAAVEFLFPDGDLQTWATLFKAVGTRQAIDPIWLRNNVPALDGKNPESAWREHLAARTRARTIEAWSDRGLQLEERLLQTLNFRPRDRVAGVPPEVPPEMFARDLIGYRGQAWVAPLAASLAIEMQSLQMGAPPLLQEALASYAAYFEQLTVAPPEKTSWWRRAKRDPKKIQPPDDATWQVALGQLWMRAERAHQSFLERHQTRKRYLDGFDVPDGGEFDARPSEFLDAPRTRWQRYVDEIEERIGPRFGPAR
jgi:hypothetical protein